MRLLEIYLKRKGYEVFNLKGFNKNPKKYGLYLRGWINRSLKALEEMA